MRTAFLILAAALAAGAKDFPFEGENLLRADYFARYAISGHRVELTRGFITYHLADSGAPPVEIVTPSVSVQPFLTGEYRVEVNRFGETHITPAGGDVRVVSPQGAKWVAPGQKLIARGPAAAPEFRIVDAVGRWGRLAARFSAAFQHMSVGASAGSDDSSSETAHHDDRAKPSPPAGKSDAPSRTPAPNHPNEGVAPPPHAGKGK
jgi:hypothetical protein